MRLRKSVHINTQQHMTANVTNSAVKSAVSSVALRERVLSFARRLMVGLSGFVALLLSVDVSEPDVNVEVIGVTGTPGGDVDDDDDEVCTTVVDVGTTVVAVSDVVLLVVGGQLSVAVTLMFDNSTDDRADMKPNT